MKLPFKPIMFLAILTQVMCSSAHAVRLGGIKGTVFDTVNGKPVSGATVVAITDTNIESEMKYSKITTKTAKDGSFIIKGIRNKGYQIFVSKQGYFRYGSNDSVYASVPNESNRIMNTPIPISSGIAGLDVKHSEYIVDKENNVMWSKKVIFSGASKQQTDDFLAILNSSKYAGYNDWRLPRGEEANSMCYKLSSLPKAYSLNSNTATIYPQNVFAMTANLQNVFNWYEILTLNGFYAMEYYSECNGERKSMAQAGSTKAIWPVRGGTALIDEELIRLAIISFYNNRGKWAGTFFRGGPIF